MRLYYNKMMTENVLNSDMRASLMTISDDSSHRESGSTAMVDLEKQELKSILKKPYKEHPYAVHIIKYMISFVTFLLCFPIVICDLYYGYSKDSCVEEYPAKLNINMKIYLLVSGYLTIGLLACIIINLYFAADDNIGNNIILVAFLSIILHISQVFFVIWNILGAVIFWGTLNKHNYCSKSINTYLFVSLIMKLFVNFCNIMANKDKKNEKK